MKWAFLLLAFVSATAKASGDNLPEFCEYVDNYKESTLFVKAPSAVGGCVGNIIGIPIGGFLGIFVGEPAGAARIGGMALNVGLNNLVGFPFFVVEYIPRKTYEFIANDRKNIEVNRDKQVLIL